LFFGGPAIQDHARFSPDGHWIAYGSATAMDPEIYVAKTLFKTKSKIESGGFTVTAVGRRFLINTIELDARYSSIEFGCPISKNKNTIFQLMRVL
jgi:Tol biopolymer transport system component